jgi:hypothetical protein
VADPILLLEIAIAASTTLLPSLAAYWHYKRTRKQIEQQPDPEPPEPEMTEEEQAEWEEHRRLLEEQRQRQIEEERRKQEEAARRRNQRMNNVIEQVTQTIQFASRRVYVGRAKTGERFIGTRTEESPYPADGVDVRPIQSLGELPNLLPSEFAFDDDMIDARIASGQALVQTHTKNVPIMQAVYNPVYEDRIRIVYVLLDISPSMYQARYGGAWRPPVWKGITVRLLDKAVEFQAPFYLRQFDQHVRRKLRTVVTPEEATKIKNLVLSLEGGDGTDISKAIFKALADFSKWDYDQADIMIVTDGQDDGMETDKLRAALEEAGIKLHAIMLGVDNETLRQVCDVYQIIEPNLTVHSPVRRGSN